MHPRRDQRHHYFQDSDDGPDHGGDQDHVAVLSTQIARELAVRATLLHHVVAVRLGLGVTDLTCVHLLRRALMPLTPTNLAELTGLTPSAITGVSDRLEAAGYVERVRDRKDRRRWQLRLLPGPQDQMTALFAPLARSVADVCRGYSDEELGAVVDFLTELGPVLDVETHRLRWWSAGRSAHHGRSLSRAGGRVP